MKAFITLGISGSGKTTWAKLYAVYHPGTVIICRDDIRQALMPNFSWKAWGFQREDEVSDLHNAALDDAIQNRRDLIVADTNINQEQRVRLSDYLADAGYDVEVKVFLTSLSECLRRDRLRGKLRVGDQVVRNQYDRLRRQIRLPE